MYLKKAENPLVLAYYNQNKLPPYVITFLRQTLRYTDLTLITQSSKDLFRSGPFRLTKIDAFKCNRFNLMAKRLKSKYIHRSLNSYSFELNCFKRWIAYDLFSDGVNESEMICILDTDCILWMSPADILEHLKSHNKIDHTTDIITYMTIDEIGDNKEVGPALTFIKKHVLSQLCEYMIDTFFDVNHQSTLDRLFYRSLKNPSGGSVSDMNLLYEFIYDKKPTIFNLLELERKPESLFFTENVQEQFDKRNVSDESVLSASEFITENGKLYIMPDNTSLLHQVVAMHFGGSAKKYIDFFVHRLPARIHSTKILSTTKPDQINLRSRTYLKLKQIYRALQAKVMHLVCN